MGNFILIGVVCVDDIILTINNPPELEKLKHYLNEEFKIKDLGDLHYFLGLEVLQEPRDIIPCQ